MQEIGLQDLIYQVKRELLAPNPRERAHDSYPLFFIEKIELEISVSISQVSGGAIKLTVLDFAEVGGNKSVDRSKGHVIKVSLSPLLNRNEILEEALRDPAIQKEIDKRAQAWVKGDSLGLIGERE